MFVSVEDVLDLSPDSGDGGLRINRRKDSLFRVVVEHRLGLLMEVVQSGFDDFWYVV